MREFEAVHQRIERHAASSPNALAIVGGGRELRFGELNARANRLARRLRALGVGEETIVGVLLTRSVDVAVAILAIMKAGGAWLPLDPSYPPERVSGMLDDARPPFVIAGPGLGDSIAGRIAIDENGGELDHDLGLSVSPRQLAYVVYTSGSTGQPKGVMVEHESLCGYVDNLEGLVGLVPSDRYLHNAALAFSSSRRQLLVPLACGAAVVMTTQEERIDPRAQLELVRRHGVTLMDVVPSFWRATIDMLEALPAGEREALLDNALRFLIVASEPLPRIVARRWKALGHHAPQLNLYGMTETAGIVAVHHVDESSDEGFSALGRPLPGVRILVLDGRLQPVADGAVGEVFIGGRMARGYLNKPELTAQRFVDDPATPGERLCRTGDQGRLLPDGTLEYVGRVDHLVKIRGFGVDLTAIESALRQHPSVRDAAVTAFADGDVTRLAAFIMPSGAPPSRRALHVFLEERLDAWAIPSAMEIVERLPLTPNGKVDRRALPRPASLSLDDDEAFVTPRTPEEAIIAAIWEAVLGLPRVSVDTSFVTLGGDSIRAVQVATRAQAEGLAVTALDVLHYPTVEALARVAGREIAGSDLLSAGGDANVEETEYELSPSQESMLFHALYAAGGSEAYLEQCSFAVEGDLDLIALERAWAGLLGRHTALRTSFAWEGLERPVQRVVNQASLPFTVVDLPTAAALEACKAEERQKGIDLSAPPLMRVVVARIPGGVHHVIWTHHHLIVDGWSRRVLLRELAHLYRAQRGEVDGALPTARPFFEFVHWLRRQDAAAARAFWMDALKGFTSPTQLAQDAAPQSVPNPLEVHDEIVHALSEEESAALVAFARRYGVTMSTVMQAAWGALLTRFSGHDDVVFGATVSGRPVDLVDVGDRVGLFINTQPVRVRLDAHDTSIDLLQRHQASSVEARRFEHTPLAEIAEWSEVAQGKPLFDTLLVYQNLGEAAVPLSDGATAAHGLTSRTSFPLCLTIIPGRQLRLSAVYHASRYRGEAVEAMLRALGGLLTGMLRTPRRLLSAVLDDMGSVLRGECATVPRAPVHVWFEAQVARTPHAAALIGGDGVMTYASLNARADAIAGHLRGLGVAPGSLVGVAMGRCFDQVASILGVMKAGGAYLPLDPTWPPSRLQEMLDDARARVILSRREDAASIPASGAAVVCVDGPLDAAGSPRVIDDDKGSDDDGLAYVIYTSGSTGKPRGVMIGHRALASFVVAATRLYGITAADRVLQFASLCFDASVEEIFPALTSGATLVLRDDAMIASATSFLSALERFGVTVADLPTAFWHDLVLDVADHRLHYPPSLRLVILGGEEARADRFALWNAHVDARRLRLVNSYGPTEATVVAVACDLDVQDDPLPIGRPLANVEAWVVDHQLRPVPPGVPGELCLGGRALARGYLGAEALTASRFIAPPRGVERLYRTGDRVVLRADGQLAYLGRLDGQVKIRGFRVELGEVEASLTALDDVGEAVALAVPEASGQHRLVACVTPSSSGIADPNALRTRLRERLPDFMVPSWIIRLDTLPRLPGGKIDRLRLSRIVSEDRPAGGADAPRTPVEKALAEIWEPLLGVSGIGVHQSFFELGGHSLLAIRILTRVQAAFGVELSLETVFQCHTIADLALEITRRRVQEVDLGDLISEIEGLSDEEVAALLALEDTER